MGLPSGSPSPQDTELHRDLEPSVASSSSPPARPDTDQSIEVERSSGSDSSSGQDDSSNEPIAKRRNTHSQLIPPEQDVVMVPGSPVYITEESDGNQSGVDSVVDMDHIEEHRLSAMGMQQSEAAGGPLEVEFMDSDSDEIPSEEMLAPLTRPRPSDTATPPAKRAKGLVTNRLPSQEELVKSDRQVKFYRPKVSWSGKLSYCQELEHTKAPLAKVQGANGIRVPSLDSAGDRPAGAITIGVTPVCHTHPYKH